MADSAAIAPERLPYDQPQTWWFTFGSRMSGNAAYLHESERERVTS